MALHDNYYEVTSTYDFELDDKLNNDINGDLELLDYMNYQEHADQFVIDDLNTEAHYLCYNCRNGQVYPNKNKFKCANCGENFCEEQYQ